MQVRGDSPRGKREAERGRIKDLEKMERVGMGVKEKRKGGEMTKQTTCERDDLMFLPFILEEKNRRAFREMSRKSKKGRKKTRS